MSILYFLGGFAGLFTKFGAYQRWCRTTATRAQYFEKMLELCGLIDDPECPKGGNHRELEQAEIRKSEEAAQKVICTIHNFMNPFDVPDKDHLYSLSSGDPASPEVERDVLCAEMIGKETKEEFVRERFLDGSSEKLFFELIKNQRLKTMESSNKAVRLIGQQGKVFEKFAGLKFCCYSKSTCMYTP